LRMNSSIPTIIEQIDQHGFALVPNQLTREHVAALLELSVRASDAYVEAWRNGLDLRDVTINPRPNFDETPNARMMYLWGDPVVELLNHDVVHAVAEALIASPYHLNDVVTNVARPRKMSAKNKFVFHRDYAPGIDANGKHRYLWFFFLLNDFTEDNGATWVVPDSHRDDDLNIGEREENKLEDPYPTKIQILGKAGDLFILNSTTLHSVGENRSTSDRRTMNIRMTGPDGVMVANHWAVATPEIREKVPPRVAKMMQPNGTPDLKTDWLVRPPADLVTA